MYIIQAKQNEAGEERTKYVQANDNQIKSNLDKYSRFLIESELPKVNSATRAKLILNFGESR